MTVSARTRLGPYEILGLLGAGGMGEVYRARDTRLDREVAVKILPAKLSSDPARLKRFEREARSWRWSGARGDGPGRILFSADGKTCVYTHHRYSSELFLVQGLK